MPYESAQIDILERLGSYNEEQYIQLAISNGEGGSSGSENIYLALSDETTDGASKLVQVNGVKTSADSAFVLNPAKDNSYSSVRPAYWEMSILNGLYMCTSSTSTSVDSGIKIDLIGCTTPTPTPTPGDSYIELFSNTNFSGTSNRYKVPDLGSIALPDILFKSIRFHRGNSAKGIEVKCTATGTLAIGGSATWDVVCRDEFGDIADIDRYFGIKIVIYNETITSTKANQASLYIE